MNICDKLHEKILQRLDEIAEEKDRLIYEFLKEYSDNMKKETGIMGGEKTSVVTKRLIDGNKEPSKSWWMDEGYMPKENPKLEFCKRMETYKSSEINPKMDKFKDITSLEELCDLVILDMKNGTIEVPKHLIETASV